MSGKEESNAELARLRSLVAADPKSKAFVELAHLLCTMGVPEEAEQICRKGLVFNTNLVEGNVALARALLDRGRLRQAQEILVDVVRNNPQNGEAMRRLGQLALRRGEKADARAILEYAEELLPDDGTVAHLLVQAGGQPSFGSRNPPSDTNMAAVTGAATGDDTTISAAPPDMGGDDVKPLTPRPSWRAGGQRDGDRPAPVAGMLKHRAEGLKRAKPGTGGRGHLWGIGIVVVGIAAIVLATRKADHQRDAQLHMEVVQPAIADGSLKALQDARLKLATVIAEAKDKVPVAALVGLVAIDTTQVIDWGLPVKVAAESIERARLALPKPSKGQEEGQEEGQEGDADEDDFVRSSRRVLAAANALLSLEGGDPDRARRLLPPLIDTRDPRFVILASARIQTALGSFEQALAVLPPDDGNGAIADSVLRARFLLDDGRSEDAAGIVESLADAADEDVRIALLAVEIAHARGLAPDPAMQGALDAACGLSGDSPAAVFACQLQVAVSGRASSRRNESVDDANRLAQALSRAPGGVRPRDLGRLALLLATVGEADRAEVVLDGATKAGGARLPESRWARIAIALARQTPFSQGDLPQTALSLDARLTAVRARLSLGLAISGPTGILLPASAGTLDPDLDAWLWWAAAASAERAGAGAAHPPAAGGTAQADIERSAHAGNPVAAFVLAQAAASGRDGATRRREKQWLPIALGPHGDQCMAALKVVYTMRANKKPQKKAKDPPPGSEALDRIQAANSACQLGRP